MVDKVLVWVWTIVLIIVVIVNSVTLPTSAPLFLMSSVSKATLAFLSWLVWIWIWFWLKGVFWKKNIENDLDF